MGRSSRPRVVTCSACSSSQLSCLAARDSQGGAACALGRSRLGGGRRDLRGGDRGGGRAARQARSRTAVLSPRSRAPAADARWPAGGGREAASANQGWHRGGAIELSPVQQPRSAHRGGPAADAGRPLHPPQPGRPGADRQAGPKATGRSAISRRFVTGTSRKLAELMGRDLHELDLLALIIDGIETDEHTIVAALGVDADGRKHLLGLWEGSTENKTVCQALLNNLVGRGLDSERPLLAVIDGGKAIRAALEATFGERVLIARCRRHKRRNVLDHLPEAQRTFIGRKLDRAWRETDVEKAEQELRDLARQLQATIREPPPASARASRRRSQ